VKSFGIPILSVLDQEDDKESHDGGTGIDNQLPGIGKMEQRAADCPENQDYDSRQEHKWMAYELCGPGGKAAEPEIDGVGVSHLLARSAERRLLVSFGCTVLGSRRVQPFASCARFVHNG